MGRRTRLLITAGVVAALVAPVVLDRDGFPLSTYPMYSRVRGDEVTLRNRPGRRPDGSPSALTLGVIGDSDDPLIVAGELRDAIRGGRADQRCVGDRRTGAVGRSPARCDDDRGRHRTS
jgi:hypothetical protein